MHTQVIKRLLTYLPLLFSKNCFCQVLERPVNFLLIERASNKRESGNKNDLSVELIASMLPQAKTTSETGRYILRSRLQSSYDIGLNYYYNLNKKTSFSTGLHFIVGKRNFFVNIPSSDLINSNPSGLLIEDKDLWGSFRIPILIEKKILSKINPLSIKAGFNLRYSGLMSDESFVATRFDSNNQPANVFYAELSARNEGKPWITFLGGLSKSILLDNKNVLSIGVQADISTTYFLKGNYEITIPNQPTSVGTYKINGSSAGLSIQYILTGTNKQLLKPTTSLRTRDFLKKENKLKTANHLEKYVLTGNNVQFNFALLSTFRAQVKKIFGNYPVNTRAARGLFLGIKYQINFNKKYSLITGLEATLAGRNLKATFFKNDFSPPLVTDQTAKGLIQDLILSLPVMAEKRWLYASRKFLFADAGLRLNFSLGADYDGFSFHLLNTSNGFYNAGGVDVNSNNDSRPWLSFPLIVGHSWLVKNNNLLQLAICSNFSFTKYVDGTYHINIPNQPVTEGRYSSTGSHIGLSLNYVFTNANYRIRKASE